MGIFEKVFIFADKADALPELCSGGRQLGNHVSVLAHEQKNEDQAKACNVDHIYRLGAAESYPTEDYTETILALILQEQPGLVIIRNDRRGKLVAGRLAAALGTSAITDIIDFETDEPFQTRRIVYGGAAMRTLEPRGKTVILATGAGIFEDVPSDLSFQGQVTEVDFIAPQFPINRLEQKSKAGQQVDLNAARKVVGVGRGFTQQEDLELARELAELIGAEVGCSRPIAEVEHWMSKDNYIGVSGAMLKPDLYLAVGISGQVQHMFGVNQAKTIIAVNKDKNAPIFKNADYGIVGDLYDVVPALVAKFKAKE